MSNIAQLLKDAHARNLAVGRSRQAAIPEVGIWWLINGKFVADSIPWRDADDHGTGFYNGKNDHQTFWRTIQRFMPEMKRFEYTDFPRGRVIYDSHKRDFMAYASRKSCASPEIKRMVLNEFSLPVSKTEFIPDEHYEDTFPELDEDF